MKKGCALFFAAVLACLLPGCALLQGQQAEQENEPVALEEFSQKVDNGKPDIYQNKSRIPLSSTGRG